MKAMILAAGLGTRLRPWTFEHPKALVPVGGVPMLERVIIRLRDEGFDDIVVNVHHFGEQIINFLKERDYGIQIRVSDERGKLLDTGGGIVHASGLIGEGPVLVHNVDILSDADLKDLMKKHEQEGAGVTLLVSDRQSSRKLIFDERMCLIGWHDRVKEIYKPTDILRKMEDDFSGHIHEYAFSGIYVVSERMRKDMERMYGDSAFPVMDYFLSDAGLRETQGKLQQNLRLIDIGKPETLATAESLFS